MSDTTLISVRVSKRVAKRLEKLADAIDRSTSYVASQAIEEFLASEEWQVSSVQRGVDQADAGKLASNDQARKQLSKWKHRGAQEDALGRRRSRRSSRVPLRR